MKIEIKKYWDKFYFSFIDYLFRKTTLNFILYFLIIVSLTEAGAVASNQPLYEFIQELKQNFPNGTFYYLLRLFEIFYVQGSWIVLVISLCFSLLVWYLKKTEISKAHSGEQMRLIQEGLDEKLEIANKSLESFRSEAEEEEKKKSEYRKFLDKINFTLQEKNISKEEIFAKFNKKLRILVFHKNMEDTSLHYIRNQFYPHIGAFYLHGGTCIVPPDKIDQRLSDKQILEWFETELRKFISDDYVVNLSIVSVVDLKSVTSINQNMHPKSKYRNTYLDGLNIDQILTLREIESFLYSEKNISSRDIIDVPSLVFLIDRDLVSLKNLNTITEQNNEIIEAIKEKIGVDQIKTTDIAQIDPNDLKQVLDLFNVNSEGIENNIIENAIFWRDYFNKKI